MTKRLWLAAASALVIGVVITATYGAAAGAGGKNHVKATLNGYQEDMSVSTTGHGTFDAFIDDDARIIEWQLNYDDLEGGNTLFAHVHFGSHDHNGGVAVFFCGGSTKPTPCPNGGGTVTGTWAPSDVVGPTGQGIEAGSFDELVAAIRAGHTYANVHTVRWPGGEIRGQVNNNDQREATK